MAELNEAEKRIIVKIVYYGPALSGKTTNLINLHDSLNPSQRGDLMSLDTKGDRTLFFDLLPLAVRTQSNFKLKFKLFTVPGQVAHDATRKSVLSRADGVVFVADSQITQARNNFESFENLEKNSRRVGIEFDNLPLVVQFNKRDLDDVVSKKEVLELWSQVGVPVTFSTAINGKGVVETFGEILKLTYRNLDLKYLLEKKYRVMEGDFLSIIKI